MENETQEVLKTVRFTFDYQEEATGEVDRWGTNKNVSMAFDFEQGDCWHHVLYQFAKFLEGVGYVGVVDRIRVEGWGFQDIDGDSPFDVFIREEKKGKKVDELEQMLEEHLNSIADLKHELIKKYLL